MKDASFIREMTLSTSLEDCSRLLLLSKLAYQVCQRNNLETVGDLLDFHYEHYRFNLDLSYCTPKNSDELKAFCKRFSYLMKTEDRPKLAPELDNVQFENFVRHMRVLVSDMSSHHRAIFLLADAHRFYREYIQDSKSLFFLANEPAFIVFSEFEPIRKQLRKYAFELQGFPATFEFDELVNTCVRHYGCKAEEIEQFRGMADAGSFPLFGFVAYLLDNGYLLNKEDLGIIEHRIGWFQDKAVWPEPVLEDEFGYKSKNLKKKVGLMRIKIQKTLKPLNDHMVYIMHHSKYEIEVNAPLIHFTEEMASKLNLEEEATFHPTFYTVIAWALIAPDYYFPNVGYSRDCSSNLIRKDIAESFNFEAYFNKYNYNPSSRLKNKKKVINADAIHPFFKKLAIIYVPIVLEILKTITSENPMKQPSSIELEKALSSDSLEFLAENLKKQGIS